jgi:hypothetical protein
MPNSIPAQIRSPPKLAYFLIVSFAIDLLTHTRANLHILSHALLLHCILIKKNLFAAIKTELFVFLILEPMNAPLNS